MMTDLEEINQIIHEANKLQTRLDKLFERQTFTVNQKVAVGNAANTIRGLRGYDLAQVKILFDPEYAAEMKRLTEAAKR